MEDKDDQKTPTAILFDNDGSFLAFGSRALQKYAEIVDDGETAMLFQTVKKKKLHFYKNYSIKWHYLEEKKMLFLLMVVQCH